MPEFQIVVVIVGVHLTYDFMRRIQSKFPHQVIPFLVYVSNEDVHVDRFASRSRNFNTEPRMNKYVQHLENIRTIQRYLRQQVEKNANKDVDTDNNGRSSVVLIDNTAISGALKLMHHTVVDYLRRRRKTQKEARIKASVPVLQPLHGC